MTVPQIRDRCLASGICRPRNSRLVALHSLHIRTRPTPCLPFPTFTPLASTLRTCHHGNASQITTLTVGRISQLDSSGPFCHCRLQGCQLLSQDIIKTTTCHSCLFPHSPDHTSLPFKYPLPGTWVCGSTPLLSILLVCLRRRPTTALHILPIPFYVSVARTLFVSPLPSCPLDHH